MERDLEQYLIDYKELPFERVQEHYRKRKIIEWLSNYKNIEIDTLEIGCGEDSIFNYWSHEGKKIIVEPIIELLFSRKNLLDGKQVEKINNRIEEKVTDFEASFDVIILSSLIHEIENPVYFLSLVKKMIKRNGKILVVTNNKLSIHRILGVNLGVLMNLDSKTDTEKIMQHKTGAFSKIELQKLVKECKMKIKRIETFSPKILPHSMMKDALVSGCIDEKFLDQMYSLIQWIPDFGSEIIIEMVNDE
jgi:2-polyprenyl-3-methyl-5-hydroxy-6-metoxy-1,4-benzoquinol methylase